MQKVHIVALKVLRKFPDSPTCIEANFSISMYCGPSVKALYTLVRPLDMHHDQPAVVQLNFLVPFDIEVSRPKTEQQHVADKRYTAEAEHE